MSLKAALLAICCLLIGYGFARGEQREPPIPKVAVPANLEPYADALLVLKNARRAIALLTTAQFRLDPYPEPPSRKITPECDTEEIRSFNRGYLLAHTGYNLFLALQELDVPRVEGPNGLAKKRRRNFVQFGRAALLTVWTPSRLRDLLKVRQTLRDLPDPIRQDLSAFLSKLLEYRHHYARFKKERPEVLDDLFRREDDAYFWYHSSVPKWVHSNPSGLAYDELSELLDDQLREISDVAKTDRGRCFVWHYGPTITFPSEKLENDRTWIYPTKYLISFWRRRDMEGTSDLADYVIAQVLETLREP